MKLDRFIEHLSKLPQDLDITFDMTDGRAILLHDSSGATLIEICDDGLWVRKESKFKVMWMDEA